MLPFSSCLNLVQKTRLRTLAVTTLVMPKRHQEDAEADRYRPRPRRTYQQEGDSYSSYGRARGYREQRGGDTDRRESSSRRRHDEDDRHWRPSRHEDRDRHRDSGSGTYRTTRSYHSTPARSPDRPSTRRYPPREASSRPENGKARGRTPTQPASHGHQLPREPAADRITRSRPPFLAPGVPPREPAKDRMLRNLPPRPGDDRRVKSSSPPRHKSKLPPREPAADRAPSTQAQALPQEPTTAYLDDSLKPSVTLSRPTDLRKLLALDLNGTLVLRSPYKAPARGSTAHNPYANPYAPRPLRTVLPRPFLPSFREYLFHPKTREWLDTMVWSSAQPHSVDDMVHRAFCDPEVAEAKDKDALVSSGKLVAVWARDTLGLPSNAYFQKTQTTKNLETPWKHFQASEGVQHSASSTLLLDDSPLKARLQPWNHLCVKEYTSEMRLIDLQVLSEESTTSYDIDDYCDHDLTLLAVIGALDAIKWESNVAGWIRGGGLSINGVDGAGPLQVEDPQLTSTSLPTSPAADPPPSSPPSSPPLPSPPEVEHTAEERVAGGMWFEESPNVIAWAARGLSALKALGVVVVTGVVPIEEEEKRLKKKDKKRHRKRDKEVKDVDEASHA
ncbi:FCP1 homology domain-containing protein [Pleurotus pulmonarius]